MVDGDAAADNPWTFCRTESSAVASGKSVMEPRWTVSSAASSLHAAAALLNRATVVDRRISAELAPEAEGLGQDLAAAGIERPAFFEHAVPLCVQLASPPKWAEVVVTKLLGVGQETQQIAARLARRLVGLIAALERAHQGSLEELELRCAPLREQWEARGAGLLSCAARLTSKELLVDEADVILLHPVLGGGGAAHVLYNSVRIEAVLANPIPDLPEVARLGWLIAQLNLDLPQFSDHLPRDRLATVGPLALVEPTLAAAQEVELSKLDEPTLAVAQRAWGVEQIEPAKLLEWWETYQDTNPPWAVALGALDRMLAGA